MRNHHRGNNPHGFTLLELLVTLALAAIILAIGVPAFTELIRNNRQVSTSHTLMTGLNLARSEAIKRAVRVTMCRSNGPDSCSDDNSRIWETGWIVFVDADESGDFTDTDDIIRVFEPIGGNVTLRSGGNYARFVSFLPLGNSRGNTGLPNDTFRICDPRGSSKARAVIVNAVGRARAAQAGDGYSIDCP